MSSPKSNRRDILRMLGGVTAGLGLLDTPFGKLLELMTRGVYGQALAQASGTDPRIWVDFRFETAPPRWVYDLFLNPYGTASSFVDPNTFGTRYTGSTVYDDVEYATIVRSGVNVPWMWQFPVPKAGGGTRPMTDLLPNLLQMRGVTTGNPDHTASKALHYRPLGARQTITALAGDNSDAPLAAVFCAVAGFQFTSNANKTAVQVSGSNLISSLLAPFTLSSSASFKTGRADLAAYLNTTKTAFATEVNGRNPLFSTSVQAQRDAATLFETAFGDLAATWTTLVTKYKTLITAALNQSTTLAGINDKPIGVSGTRDLTYQLDNVQITNPDLRTMFQANTTVTDSMSASFALAEFVLSRRLSNSLTLGMGTIAKLKINGADVNHNPDEHFTGKMPSLFINTYLARAHAACLLEFIDRIKAFGLWNDTVINVSGEFNRSPRLDGTGSDHNYQGANLTFYSGAVNGPKVIGNIQADNGQPNYPGSWGFGAPIAELGQQQLNLAHAGSSIAAMLRVPSPVTAASTVITENASGDFVPTLPNAKNV